MGEFLRVNKGLLLVALVLTLSLTTTVVLTQYSPMATITPMQASLAPQPVQKGVSWGQETQANTNTTARQYRASVCCFPNGSGFVIVWQSNQTGDYDIYFKIFDSTGNNKTGDIRANGNTTGTQQYPDVCCRSDGTFIVTWDSDHTGDSDVYFRIFDSSGNNQTLDIRANGYTTGGQWSSEVCCFPNGSFVIVFHDNHAGDTDVYYKIFNSTGGNTTTDVRVNTYTTNQQVYPDVCCFPDGSGFVVVWHGRGTGDTWGVYAKVFNSTGSTNDILVNTNTTSSQSSSSVCCFPDSSGFVVVWNGDQTGDTDAYAQILSKTGQNQTAGDIRINENTTGSQYPKSVCCFPDGSGFIVLWYGDQTGDKDVYVTIFDSGGQKQTGDTRLNSYTTDSQSASAVCCAQGGFVVAVWSSYRQDGDEYGVYFKIGGPSSEVNYAPLILWFMLLTQHQSTARSTLLAASILCAAGLLGAVAYWWLRRKT